MTDAEKLEKVHSFLSRVGSGYYELSHDKVKGEYRYFKERAWELLHELFPQEEPEILLEDTPVKDDF